MNSLYRIHIKINSLGSRKFFLKVRVTTFSKWICKNQTYSSSHILFFTEKIRLETSNLY
ncbi:hypothetical protein LEP1GSC059_1383 [Leptospira noguchii serovar Panama str. CZ214]|uniref:Uncharacterized protein n=1 Tax=Leptospira noguchii serovar Panama str. CZ214 TaxID=1001595 RepID=T0FGZ9_9LEPT|nr:hypothetical protein LEP1GSC059_1383 [Leptospira noguchii serovar Panama str. CZ214]